MAMKSLPVSQSPSAVLPKSHSRYVALPRVNLSYLDYVDWKRMNTVLSSMDAFSPGWNLLLRTATGTESLAGERVSAGFFRTLGVSPVLGRDFYIGEDDPSASHAVIITYGTWLRRFGGRKDAIGQAVELEVLGDSSLSHCGRITGYPEVILHRA